MVYDEVPPKNRIDFLLKRAAESASEIPWEGMESDVIPAVTLTISRQPDVRYHTQQELARAIAELFGGSFRLYSDIEPMEGYEKAVQTAEEGGFIRLTENGYEMTRKAYETALDTSFEISSRPPQ